MSFSPDPTIHRNPRTTGQAFRSGFVPAQTWLIPGTTPEALSFDEAVKKDGHH